MKHILLILSFILTSFAFELKYKSFEAEFNQSVESNKKKLHYNGKLFVKGELIFWHYIKPIEKKIWITLDKVYIYEPDLEQVTIYKKSKESNLFQIIKNSQKVKENLYSYKTADKTIYFEIEDKMIKKIYFKDKIDNLVRINFYNIVPKELNVSFFMPNYPDYVDVIYGK